MNEKIFDFNIDNIKNDLEIEGMFINDTDINLFRKFANNEINMPELINIIQSNPIGE